jgi:hypothetical protein
MITLEKSAHGVVSDKVCIFGGKWLMCKIKN